MRARAARGRGTARRCYNVSMLRGSLLAAALFTLLGLGSGAGHVRNGRIAYSHLGASGNRSQIYTTHAGGTRRHRLTSSRRYSSLSPSYSPNGMRIVFVQAFKQSDLWTMSADGTRKRRLTSTSGIGEVDPAWSPDGKEIVFAVSSPAAALGIWVIGADGLGRRQLTSGADTHPAWSPDGSQIAFQRFDPTTATDAIFLVPATGGAPTRLVGAPLESDLQPAWSPDGTRILFASDRPDEGPLDLWVIDLRAATPALTAKQVTKSPGLDDHDPAWSPDGRKITYVAESSSHGSASWQLYVSNANGSNRHIVTHACGACAIINDDPSWQPLRG